MSTCKHCGNKLVNSKNLYCTHCNPFTMSAKNKKFVRYNLWKADENDNNKMKPGTLDEHGNFIFIEDDFSINKQSVAELLNLPLGDGILSTITTGGVITDNEIVFTDIAINKIIPTEIEDGGYYDNAWCVSVKLTAPKPYTSGAKYKSRIPSLVPADEICKWEDIEAKNFDEFKDGNHFITFPFYFSPEFLDNYVKANKMIICDYIFDWNHDGVYEQMITIKIDPAKLTLKNTNGTKIIYPVAPMVGTLETITEGGVVKNNNVSFLNDLIINKSPEADLENSNHRQSAWYVGVKLIAPEGYVSGAKYKSRTPRLNPENPAHEWDTLELKDFDTYKDGDYFITLWPYLSPEFVDIYINAGVNIVYDYIIDWHGDGRFDQTITVTVDPTKLTLMSEDGSEVIYPEPSIIEDEEVVE